jgi:hypothetical protein
MGHSFCMPWSRILGNYSAIKDFLINLLRDDREDQSGRMLVVVVDPILGGYKACCWPGIVSGVQISVEAREVAAGNFEAKLVAWSEHITRRPEVNSHFVDLSRGHVFSF